MKKLKMKIRDGTQMIFDISLCSNALARASVGILRRGIAVEAKQKHGRRFQNIARELIINRLTPYDREEKIRMRIKRWKFADPPAHVANHIVMLLGR